jgi:hypothetical protein
MKMDQIMAQSKGEKRKADCPIATMSGPPRKRVLPPMPIHVLYQPLFTIVSFENQGGQIHFYLRAPQIQGWPSEPVVDAYRVRDAFLRVKTSGEATEFLSLTGFFLEPKRGSGIRPRLDMTWAEFQQWQELIRLILTEGFFKLTEKQTEGISRILPNVPTSMHHLLSRLYGEEQLWLAGHAQGIMIHPRGGDPGPFGRDEPIAMIMVDSTLEAILATIYLDRLNGLDHGLCALKDCPKIYEVTSKHARQYCSQECAHKASVRKRRALAAQAKAKAKAPKSTRDKRGQSDEHI